MNILMISDVYFPRINGVSTSIIIFRQALVRLGHRVTLIAPHYGECTANEADIVRIAARPVPIDPEDRMMRANLVLQGFAELQRQHFDVLHIQTPFVAHRVGVKLSRRLNIPRIATYHTFFEEYLFHYIPLLPRTSLRATARLFSRRQCNNLDGVVVPSRAMWNTLLDYGVKTPMRIIPTGTPPDLLQEGDGTRFRLQHDIPLERPTLVHVGRVAFEKNIDFIFHVVQTLKRQYPNILLIIAGEGPARRHLVELGAQLTLTANLLFVGYLPRGTALADCYRAGDAFVFASRTETQGLVLLEAMSLGVPVVSTAVMGTRDILQAGCGALVAAETVEDFAAKVHQVLQDRQLRRRLAAEGPAYARQWRPAGLAQRLADFYQETIAQRNGASFS